MAYQQFFQENAFRTESQRARAQTANGTRRRFEHPRAFVIDPKLRVNRAVREAQRLHGAFGAIQETIVRFIRQARGRHVKGLFKIRPFERVRLVKDAENSQFSASEQSLDGHFRAGDVAFHEQVVELWFARGLYFRRLQQQLDPRDGGLKFFRIIRANYALARGQPERLDYTRKLDARENFFHSLVDPEGEKSGHGKTSVAQHFALAQFAAAIFDGLRMVVGKGQRAGGVGCRCRWGIT